MQDACGGVRRARLVKFSVLLGPAAVPVEMRLRTHHEKRAQTKPGTLLWERSRVRSASIGLEEAKPCGAVRGRPSAASLTPEKSPSCQDQCSMFQATCRLCMCTQAAANGCIVTAATRRFRRSKNRNRAIIWWGAAAGRIRRRRGEMRPTPWLAGVMRKRNCSSETELSCVWRFWRGQTRTERGLLLTTLT